MGLFTPNGNSMRCPQRTDGESSACFSAEDTPERFRGYSTNRRNSPAITAKKSRRRPRYLRFCRQLDPARYPIGRPFQRTRRSRLLQGSEAQHSDCTDWLVDCRNCHQSSPHNALPRDRNIILLSYSHRIVGCPLYRFRHMVD